MMTQESIVCPICEHLQFRMCPDTLLSCTVRNAFDEQEDNYRLLPQQHHPQTATTYTIEDSVALRIKH